jgi:hypothetical protein
MDDASGDIKNEAKHPQAEQNADYGPKHFEFLLPASCLTDILPKTGGGQTDNLNHSNATW